MTMSPRIWGRRVLGLIMLVLCLGSCILLGGCAGPKALQVPPPAPDAQAVYIPVPKPCKVEKVTPSPLATAAGVPHDIFGAVQRILADRELLKGDRTKALAAASDPCPQAAQ